MAFGLRPILVALAVPVVLTTAAASGQVKAAPDVGNFVMVWNEPSQHRWTGDAAGERSAQRPPAGPEFRVGYPSARGGYDGYGGYGGYGGYPCGTECKRCKRECGTSKRECASCARGRKNAAWDVCLQTATSSLAECAPGDDACRKSVKDVLRSCKAPSKPQYTREKKQCRDLRRECKSCCRDGEGSCGNVFLLANGPGCAPASGLPGGPGCFFLCEDSRANDVAGCGGDSTCLERAEAVYQSCLAVCRGLTTTTTTIPTDGCQAAGWGCCVFPAGGELCAREFGGSEDELVTSYAFCTDIDGATWTAGRCSDPLCGPTIGCCFSQSSQRYACEQGFFGSPASDAGPRCTNGDGTFTSERCPEPPDPCPPGSPPDCCRNRADCDDGLACNGAETCRENRCQPGIPMDCSVPSDRCVEWRCEENGVNGGQCVPVLIAPQCDDGDACNGHETVDCTTGACVVGEPLDCDQYDDFCSDYRCTSSEGYAQCVVDTLPQPVCDDGNGCNGYEFFSCSAGACQAGTRFDCDQYDNYCTDYSCASFGGRAQCLSTSIPQPNCDDGDACNGYEYFDCTQGACKTGPSVFCPPGTRCVSTNNSASCGADG